MGYVNESSRSSDRKFQPGTWDYAGFHAVWPDFQLPTTSKTQFGYRSGPLGPAELSALHRADHGNRATMGKTLGALEAIYRAEQGGLNPWMVNSRDYTELRCAPGEFLLSSEYKLGSTWIPTRSRGAIGITGIVSTSFPTVPSTADAQNWASKQIRTMRPTKPDFRLARFLGELRDANKMFRPDSYFLDFYARSGRHIQQSKFIEGQKRNKRLDPDEFTLDFLGAAGTASLNYQFAVMPTSGDIKRGAEAVLRSEKIVKQYLRDMNAYVRRSGSRLIEAKTFSGLTSWTTVSPFDVSTTLAGMTIRGLPGTIHTDQYRSGLEGYLNTRLEQRVFSTYRYAPENAEHLLGVWDSYVGKAQRVLGLKLDLQTFWDLLPFSWMFDWFVDIGGLLGYQQDVADYKLVAKRAGYVMELTGHGQVGLREAGANSSSTRYKRNVSDGFATVVYKNQTRRSGNPYGMTPDWSFNSFQWGILASLGLAWLPNVPVFRRG